jgi:hypothetical protein
LGAAIDVLDESGRPLRGEVGELVLTRALPSMPVRFWDDPDGERYRASYFADFPGHLAPRRLGHADPTTAPSRSSGRSDSTLNRHGVRIGTAEIYAAVDRSAAVADSLVIGVEQPDGGYWMALFVALEATRSSTTPARTAIVEAIRTAASPRHVPDEILQVPAVPRTMTGKKLEVPIKRLFMGADPATAVNRNAVADPRGARRLRRAGGRPRAHAAPLSSGRPPDCRRIRALATVGGCPLTPIRRPGARSPWPPSPAPASSRRSASRPTRRAPTTPPASRRAPFNSPATRAATR